MDILMLVMILFGISSISLLVLLFRTVNRLTETNKQLFIVVAGKDEKPEALRALVASNKPPQKNLGGIATKKKSKESKNTDFTMNLGVS